MIIYKNTFENIKTLNCDFPIEDSYYADDCFAIVADGITRDPIGISDLYSVPFEELKRLYPRPSGGELAARELTNFATKYIKDLDIKSNSEQAMRNLLIEGNQSIKGLNDRFIPMCDYLQNDYYGTVAACATIIDNQLYYAYICDCGVIVYDKDGNVKFQTEDDKALYSDPYINKIGIAWNLPESRIIVRRDYRNNVNNIQDNQCVSYGALTGEDDAVSFIRSGCIKVDSTDTIVVYSDGFTSLLRRPDFIDLVIHFDCDVFEQYVGKVSNTDYERYGKEKTLVIMKSC